MSVAINGHGWTRQPQQHVPADWELQSELEYWDRLAAEYAEAGPALLEFLAAHRRMVADELDRRARIAYLRQRQPFSDLGPIIEEVKARTDLLALFGARLGWQGKSSSSAQKFRCFLHDDDTPSLVLWPQRGRWWCFGCGNGGDAITAVMKLENVSFVQAVLHLAGEYGIQVQERPRRAGLVRFGAR